MRFRRIAAGMTLIFGGLAAPSVAAERPEVVREALTIQSHRMVINPTAPGHHRKKRVSRLMPVDVAVYRPNDGLKHPAVVYLHGGGYSFEDPVMARFHTELARRGLVVLAPHYLLDGTGWPHWHESAVNTVNLAASLPSVDAERIGMSGLSMGGQIGLSTAARDPRIKKVAEFFTAWPGSLPDEPIDKLPPVLLINGTADPIIPFDKALVLDEILKEHKLPFERHVYEGLGHGFGTASSFQDGVLRTAAFFGGDVDRSEWVNPASSITGVGFGSSNVILNFGDEFAGSDDLLDPSSGPSESALIPKRKKKRRRPVAANPDESRPVVAAPSVAKP